jgi:hypothetical protein
MGLEQLPDDFFGTLVPVAYDDMAFKLLHSVPLF